MRSRSIPRECLSIPKTDTNPKTRMENFSRVTFSIGVIHGSNFGLIYVHLSGNMSFIIHDIPDYAERLPNRHSHFTSSFAPVNWIPRELCNARKQGTFLISFRVRPVTPRPLRAGSQ